MLDQDHCPHYLPAHSTEVGHIELPRLFSKKSWFPDIKELMAAEAGEMAQLSRVLAAGAEDQSLVHNPYWALVYNHL